MAMRKGQNVKDGHKVGVETPAADYSAAPTFHGSSLQHTISGTSTPMWGRGHSLSAPEIANVTPDISIPDLKTGYRIDGLTQSYPRRWAQPTDMAGETPIAESAKHAVSEPKMFGHPTDKTDGKSSLARLAPETTAIDPFYSVVLHYVQDIQKRDDLEAFDLVERFPITLEEADALLQHMVQDGIATKDAYGFYTISPDTVSDFLDQHPLVVKDVPIKGNKFGPPPKLTPHDRAVVMALSDLLRRVSGDEVPTQAPPTEDDGKQCPGESGPFDQQSADILSPSGEPVQLNPEDAAAFITETLPSEPKGVIRAMHILFRFAGNMLTNTWDHVRNNPIEVATIGALSTVARLGFGLVAHSITGPVPLLVAVGISAAAGAASQIAKQEKEKKKFGRHIDGGRYWKTVALGAAIGAGAGLAGMGLGKVFSGLIHHFQVAATTAPSGGAASSGGPQTSAAASAASSTNALSPVAPTHVVSTSTPAITVSADELTAFKETMHEPNVAHVLSKTLRHVVKHAQNTKSAAAMLHAFKEVSFKAFRHGHKAVAGTLAQHGANLANQLHIGGETAQQLNRDAGFSAMCDHHIETAIRYFQNAGEYGKPFLAQLKIS